MHKGQPTPNPKTPTRCLSTALISLF
ncbi:unnamed protein product [Tuber melanosporum]|uniref:(Perigord truffle) hypothetical protein n=1 Tax=Tuber melanosporum (strain Mel28) TaxID=656061 RepID=D5GD04_TUBMM|nr:unnamed protein product [Tuber melanosporum]